MYVYFVKTVVVYPAAVKIGKAKNIKDRLSNLQIGCPYDLELVGSIACRDDKQASKLEKTLHGQFKDDHIRGEWFLYSSRIPNMAKIVLARWPCDAERLIYTAHKELVSPRRGTQWSPHAEGAAPAGYGNDADEFADLGFRRTSVVPIN